MILVFDNLSRYYFTQNPMVVKNRPIIDIQLDRLLCGVYELIFQDRPIMFFVNQTIDDLG